MKYLEIKSAGEIEPEAISLMGASTKRDDTTKIGMFGSGNKFAIAYFVRNGIAPEIYSGTRKIEIGTSKKNFRGMDFDSITVNGAETSLTTQMGKDWKCWMAIREIYSNAKDEGDASIRPVDKISPEPGKTSFYIPANEDVKSFSETMEDYFSSLREPLFECDAGRLLRADSAKGVSLYRKGIRCANEKSPSIFDYDFNEIDITEDRLIKYQWKAHELAFEIISSLTDRKLIKQYLSRISDKGMFENNPISYADISFSGCGKEWEDEIRGLYFCPEGIAGYVKESERLQTSFVNAKVYTALEQRFGKEILPPCLRSSGSLRFRNIETSAADEKKISGAVSFCKAGGINVSSYPIRVVEFFDKSILAEALNGEILISDRVISMGLRKTASALIEEYIHLKTGAKDETREFQNEAINMIIGMIEEKTGDVI